jgi:hypothetical protein
VTYAPPVPQPQPGCFSYHEVIEDIGEPSLPDTTVSIERCSSSQSLPSVIDLAPPTHTDKITFESTSKDTDQEEASEIEIELNHMDRLRLNTMSLKHTHVWFAVFKRLELCCPLVE